MKQRGRNNPQHWDVNAAATFDLIGLQIEMLQCGADDGDSLQFVVAQVQFHQSSHIEGVGRDALVCELVVCQSDILQLSQSVQEALWQKINGVVLHVELVQVCRQ